MKSEIEAGKICKNQTKPLWNWEFANTWLKIWIPGWLTQTTKLPFKTEKPHLLGQRVLTSVCLFQRMSCTPWRGRCLCCGGVESMPLWPSSSSHSSSTSSTCGCSTSWWQTQSQGCVVTIGGPSSGSSSATSRPGLRNRVWSLLLTATSVE